MRAPFFDDFTEGQELPSIPPELVTREKIIAYAGASGDYNPMHVDEVTNVAGGMGGVFAHGMFGTGLLGRLVTDALHDRPLRSFYVRCTKIVRPGDTLYCKARVARRWVEGGEGLVEFALEAVDQTGDVTHTGNAVAKVPVRPARHLTDGPNKFVPWRVIG